jgi:azurin
MAYIPDSDNVLYHTGLMQPESSESIYFTAPTEKGDYTFVCTFPGHYTIMQGVLRVR